MIRFILVCIVVIAYLVLTIPVLLVEWIIGKFSPMTKDISSLRMVQAIFKFILWITGAKVTVIGEENVPKDQAVLYVANHRSYFDILLTYSRCPIRTGYVAKKEMERYPLLSNWMRNLYCLFLDRKNMKEGLKTILTGIDYLKAGTSIVIFPEGTRNKSIDGVLPFHAGSFKLAEKSGCRIIPMVQNNTAAALEDHLPFFKKTHTVLEFGKPIDVASMDREQKKNLAKDVQDLIEKMYEENKALV